LISFIAFAVQPA